MSAGPVPIALWLVPAEPWHARLDARIRELGRAHDGPAFEPHVTLDVGTVAGRDALPDALGRACAAFAPIEVAAGATAHSDAHFKTLYVELDDPRLHALRAALRDALGIAGDDYVLRPHLSLLYHGGLDPAVRAALAAGHRHDGESIVFDTVVAVLPPPGGDLYDIARIDTSLRRRLAGAPRG